MTKFAPDPDLIARFAGELDRLVAADLKLGIAVSGGPDSLALLLLAAAARPERLEAATVDHALRPESRAEAEMVAGVCGQLSIPHAILTAEWEQKPESALQERARIERYRLLGLWAKERGISALLTAHHADDQAETLVMRLNRGSGVRGLAGMRAVRRLGGDPADSGSAMGQVHHVWEDLKGAITGHDNEAIVKQTEAAEDYLKTQYEDALKKLDGDARQVVEQCYQKVRQGHDEISSIKHGMEAHS